jgi:hypothetical protein
MMTLSGVIRKPSRDQARCPERALDSSPSADRLLYESPAGIQSVSTAHVVQGKMLEMLSATQDGLYSPEGGLWHGVEAR